MEQIFSDRLIFKRNNFQLLIDKQYFYVQKLSRKKFFFACFYFFYERSPVFCTTLQRTPRISRWWCAHFADDRRVQRQARGKPEIAIAAEEESVESRTLVFSSTTLNRSRRGATRLVSARLDSVWKLYRAGRVDIESSIRFIRSRPVINRWDKIGS